MKKILFAIVLVICSAEAFSDVRRNPSQETYYMDRRISELKSTSSSYAGVITRFGYGFNYDAFTYGASLLYHFDGLLGVTAGFDGYYMPSMKTILNDGSEVSISQYNMPLWDVRAGFLVGKYFAFGGLCGKWMIERSDVINMRDNAWFVNNSDSKVMYGGWVTFILPIGKYLGFNLDFAVTNKTGFNIGGGINLTLPVK